MIVLVLVVDSPVETRSVDLMENGREGSHRGGIQVVQDAGLIPAFFNLPKKYLTQGILVQVLNIGWSFLLA